jgi:hypothetical protein
MEPVIDYDIVAAGDFAGLVMQIKGWIKKGWEPQGGVSCDEGLYFQAIVKRSTTLTNLTLSAHSNALHLPMKDYYPGFEETNEQT